MLDTFKKRLEDLMHDRGFNMKSLSLASGLSETYVREVLKRDKEPAVRNVELLAKTLNCPPAYLIGWDVPTSPEIPVIGYASGGEGWIPYDNLDDILHIDLNDKSLISIEVKGDSMSPAYRNGDFLVCNKVDGAGIYETIGRDCVIYTSENESYIKILTKGTNPTTYNLRSYNPTYPDIEDVKVKWAAPVVWVKRNNF